MRKSLMVAVLAPLCLAARCEHLTRSVVDRPELARIDPVLEQPCNGVSDIPDRQLSERETAGLWATDRRNLGDCKARHGALVTAIGAIEGQGR